MNLTDLAYYLVAQRINHIQQRLDVSDDVKVKRYLLTEYIRLQRLSIRLIDRRIKRSIKRMHEVKHFLLKLEQLKNKL